MSTSASKPLPKGQFDLGRMPRFGLPPFASRLPSDFHSRTLDVSGDVERPSALNLVDSAVLRRDQISDFHCVTTWSCRDLAWRGWSFLDLWNEMIFPQMIPAQDAGFVIFIGRDGYAACLPLEDALTADIMIADGLNGVDLTPENGAPLRLIAPAHYGYKSVKHLRAIKIVKDRSAFRSPFLSFMIHPRGRVALEERGSGVPAWLLRRVYRLFIRPNIWLFQRALQSRITSK